MWSGVQSNLINKYNNPYVMKVNVNQQPYLGFIEEQYWNTWICFEDRLYSSAL